MYEAPCHCDTISIPLSAIGSVLNANLPCRSVISAVIRARREWTECPGIKLQCRYNSQGTISLPFRGSNVRNSVLTCAKGLANGQLHGTMQLQWDRSMPICDVVIKGYLTKQGGQHKTWKRRWFQLNVNGDLAYYHNPHVRILCFSFRLCAFVASLLYQFLRRILFHVSARSYFFLFGCSRQSRKSVLSNSSMSMASPQRTYRDRLGDCIAFQLQLHRERSMSRQTRRRRWMRGCVALIGHDVDDGNLTRRDQSSRSCMLE